MNPQINALLGQAFQYFEQGNPDAAEPILLKILQMHAKNFDALHILGVIKAMRNDQQEAIKLFRKAISIEANNNFLHFNLAKALLEVGKDEDAIAHHRKAVQLAPGHVEAWLNYGVSLTNLGRYEEALSCYEKVFALEPRFPKAWVNYGTVLYKMARYQDALAAYDKALALVPDHAESWSNSGAALAKLEGYQAAVGAYEKALSLNPALAETWFNYGVALRRLERYTDALAAYNKALEIDPSQADAWKESGNVFYALRWYEAALTALDKALAISPSDADIWMSKGAVQMAMQHSQEALTSFEQAITLQPQSASGWLQKGWSLSLQRRYDEALVAYEQALTVQPDQDWLYGNWVHCKLLLCDWRDYTSNVAKLHSLIAENFNTAEPFAVLATTDDPLIEMQCAQRYTQALYPDKRDSTAWPTATRGSRIKIAYFSADLHQHATAHLIMELFELHDRTRFEIIAFSFGAPSEDSARQRITTAVDQFIDVREKSDQEIVALSRSLGIDIAVDLKGYTTQSRMGIFAHGAAPLQVSYLGYPGTVGAPYMDYIIADATVIPPELSRFYSEKIVRLPHSYQVNDRTRKIADNIFSRAELGLPEQGFVFACFNSSYKITPDCFDIWMRLLDQVPGSVLWLFEDTPGVTSTLRVAAGDRGINAERLVFAPRLDAPLHLARHRQADLFLDTFNYNAHTTASDALWAGLPVLTKQGNTFASRVAASLLTAIGLPELITTSNEEYAALAIQLASNSELLASFKLRLSTNRLSYPLFDSSKFTRHIESAYHAMHERRLKGLEPAHIDISD
ncbi:putative O-linked N-acetylglucosamine transferase (SPINDLY family) [Herbaspirillum sp. Sphag1AN]|uniref:tetratricopeptide repeat protein n=1 Tax=unclassified Herbaspirillum TaxID=2624150 RepID=UPI00160DF2F5|nr:MULTISPECIES: glycosyltransferase family 41 protein [unclassified Herbaspirillum]MBB3213368.1 putative O-linked N-acetylglucosamine transferase (SPINDLY family) [Herbaspirillum sp. Sphag1AN]MBB3246588.1 putative O-linked N-acetylglucosamine transferase (SPINDLY family) [Herbaspirillum sp. Sphag64]